MTDKNTGYLYLKLMYADFICNTPERTAFKKHLDLVAKALREIEFADSPFENDAIRACLSDTAVLESIIETASYTIKQLQNEIDRVKNNDTHS